MGTVVVHAGMGKAGSSSVQAWLAGRARALREHGVEVLTSRLRFEHDRPVDLEAAPYATGSVNTNATVAAYSRHELPKERVFDRLMAALDAAAARRGVAILSEEALERVFWRADEEFLVRLEELAGRHRVRVAYYVRPQHGALEAGWRQWGFRWGRPPSTYLAMRSKALHYADTLATVRRLAPSVSFEPRAFRRDLLAEGDPAVDFARTFVGIEELVPEPGVAWANPGFPLELVNALRHAPEGLLWQSVGDNERLNAVKRMLGDLQAPESERTRRSREVLQAVCHEIYEGGNRRLIEQLGWRTEGFVPAVAVDEEDRARGLELLDELWEPHASAVELAALFTALDRTVSVAERVSPEASTRRARPVGRRSGPRWGRRWSPPWRTRTPRG